MESKKEITVFVMMPFGSNGEYTYGNLESNYIYSDIIVPAIHSALSATHTYRVIREVDRNITGSISHAIVRNIAAADIVIADLTGRNPNVFLELGIRFALRDKTTILIAQEGTNIPLDVATYRTIFYISFMRDAVIQRIADAIHEGLDRQGTDSLVFDAFDEISVEIPEYANSYSSTSVTDRNRMLWSEYWERIQEICAMLKEPASNGQFIPDAIMGISNGGMIVADLVGRQLFRGSPILGLWANRFSNAPGNEVQGYPYFSNDFNEALINVLKSKVQGRNAVLLLLDDHLGTGTTVQQLKAYLTMHFDNQVDILYIPMFSRRPEYFGRIEDVFPHNFNDGKTFSMSKEEFQRSLFTESSHLPYHKEISGA